MKLRTLIILILAIIIITSVLLLLINKPSVSKSPSMEKCSTIYNNNGNLNLVFLADKETAKKYADFLLTISPFSQHPDDINFFSIDYTPNCELYQGIAILCYSSELIKKASSCPNDIIIALQSQPASIRSSSYMQVLSLNTNLPLSVFPHELGHALANLAEEYTPAKIPSKSKNCQSNCDKFDVKDGCFPGCSDSEHFRSVDRGIMKTLSSSSYGLFDENLILQNLNKKAASLAGNAVQEDINCADEKYYFIQGSYQSGKIAITKSSLEQGCLGSNGNGNFQYKVILADNSVLENNFNPELIFTDTQNESRDEISGEVFESTREFVLKVPVIDNAKSLEVYSPESLKLAEINLEDIPSVPCKIA